MSGTCVSVGVTMTIASASLNASSMDPTARASSGAATSFARAGSASYRVSCDTPGSAANIAACDAPSRPTPSTEIRIPFLPRRRARLLYPRMSETNLQLITIGRVGVDLYPEQIGVPLAKVRTFAKSLGGSPTNVAVAAARLGHRSAVITEGGAGGFGAYVRGGRRGVRRS